MFDFLKKSPEPDFEVFKRVICGEVPPKKVHQAELLIDKEVMIYISKNYLDGNLSIIDLNDKKNLLKWYINWWYCLGYDYVGIIGSNFTELSFEGKRRISKDTADLSRGEREWVEEGKGMIQSWQDFESYPWPNVEHIDFSWLEWIEEFLPEGMKVLVTPSSGVFEIVSEVLLGFENMSYLLYENPHLVEAVFNRVGAILYSYYSIVASSKVVGGFFQGDDMGYKTSTIVSPEVLKKLVLPWHKKFAQLAHRYNKAYFLHSCGNIFNIMPILIDDVEIDAYHSFQDEILPIWEFKKQFGNQVGYLGGVDVNKLCLSSEEGLRAYIRKIISACFPGRFAIGTGNSVANYVPPENYLIMLDEVHKFNEVYL